MFIWKDTPWLRFFIPVLLGAIVLSVYVASLTSWHSGDDIQWAMTVEGTTLGESPLHPALADRVIDSGESSSRIRVRFRYLLELPTDTRAYQAARSLINSENAVRPIQLVHAIFGAIGVIFFYLAMSMILQRRMSILLSLGLASSYAWWYYSTHLDYTIIAHSWSAILLYLLVRLCQPDSSRTVKWIIPSMGIVTGIIMLYLLTGAIVMVPVLVCLFVRFQARAAWSKLALYLTSMLLTVFAVAYLVWVSDVRLPLSVPNLLNQLTYSGAFSHSLRLIDIVRGLFGFTKALITYPALGTQDPNSYLLAAPIPARLAYLTWYLIAIGIAVLPMILLFRLRRQLEGNNALALGLGSWFLVQFPFGIYWEPSYIKWWTGSLLPWWGLLGILLTVLATKTDRAKQWLRAGTYALVILIFMVNFFADFLPKSKAENNEWLAITETLAGSSGTDDLFLTPGHHPLNFYLPYFGRRQTLSYALMQLSQGDEAAYSDLVESIRTAHKRGGRIFAYDLQQDQNSDFLNLLESQSLQIISVEFEGPLPPGLDVYEITADEP